MGILECSRTDEPPVIGIDLGTTFSAVACVIDGRPEVFVNELGSRVTPSWVALDEGEWIVGEPAKKVGGDDVFYDIKRILGHKYNDPEIQEDLQRFSFGTCSDAYGNVLVKTADGRKYRPEEISAKVLEKMKNIAESALNREVKRAVITVPAYFKDCQRKATQTAARIAGLDCIRIINEPTAACLCYGRPSGTVLIYDLGGGTLDVSVLRLSDGIYEVLATNGDTHLGGEDFDQRIVDWCLRQAQSANRGLLPSADKPGQELRLSCERAKRELSSLRSTVIEFRDFGFGSGSGSGFRLKLVRAEFEEMCSDLFERCLAPVDRVLSDSDVLPEEISEIVLVGGSTRIPRIQELLRARFGGKPLNKSVNPDEAVACGAAVQAAALSGGDSAGGGILLLDVTPLSLGIEANGGLMVPLVPRNSTLPIRKSQVFSTAEDSQTLVKVKIFEGERKFTRDNYLLGEFELSGIAPAPRGVPKIEVNLDVNVDGVLRISATDLSTGKSNEVSLTKETAFTEEELRCLLADADRHRAADELRRESLMLLDDFERYLKHVQDAASANPGSISSEESSYLSQYVLNSLEWIESHRNEGTVDPNLVAFARKTVEEDLREILNAVYAAAIAPKKKKLTIKKRGS
ncbi:MAG: Hsp70 family protein [Sulfobacillus sp.]